MTRRVRNPNMALTRFITYDTLNSQEVNAMPTKHPRLNVVLEPPAFYSVKQLAKRDGVSLSLKARDLIREALELHEDAYWAKKAHARMKNFKLSDALTHEQVWAHLKKRRQ